MKFERFMGRGAALWAAAAMAVSPGCVFYGRYAIHEYWLVFALMITAWGLAGLWKFGERKYLWATWAGVTLMVLTKETYFIHLGCFALTFACIWLLGSISPAADENGAPAAQQWTAQDMLVCALIFAGCVVFFYSGGGMDFPKNLREEGGLNGLYYTYAAWAKTGKTGNGHEKPFYYWVELFGIYEWPSCAGLLAALLSVWPKAPRFVRGVAIYGCGALAAYSIIPYKTPWCIVSLTWPFLLLFGWGIDWAIGKTKNAPVLPAIGVILCAANAGFAIWLNFFHYDDAKQKYVYVQTFRDVNKLMDPVNKLVALNPTNKNMVGNILLSSYHPLPWLLGDFTSIGYYEDDNTPTKMDADFLLVEDSRIDEIENAHCARKYFTAPLRLRDAQDESRLYLSVKKFQVVFPGRKPDFVPVPTAPAVPGTERRPVVTAPVTAPALMDSSPDSSGSSAPESK